MEAASMTAEAVDGLAAWFVDFGNIDMLAATAHGEDEARRLAAAELERRGLTPRRPAPRVSRSFALDLEARERGEGAIWAFWQ